MDIKFNTSNVVMGVFFTEKFNIDNLFELLPCTYVSFDYKKAIKIPFFGTSNCIISCQKEKEYRGLRNTKGFKNALCLDFQNDCKNVHIKITGNKFHITGAKTFEKGMQDSEICLDIIKQIDFEWKEFFILNFEDKFSLCKKALNLLTFDDKLLMYDDELVFDRFSEIEKSFYKHSNILLKLLKFSYEYNTIELFAKKMDNIIKINPCENYIFNEGKEININKGIIYNGIYNYKYPFDFFLPEFSSKLNDRGYTVGYHNFLGSKKMDVSIHVLNDNNEPIEVLKYKKIPTHKFNINANGSVRQTSPTTTEVAYKNFLLLKKDILEINEELKI